MKTIVLSALRLFLVLSVLTGIVYPVTVTVFAQLLFPGQANGSVVRRGGKAAGSRLLAQAFTDSRYFWPRPSATDYATVPAGASNAAPTNRHFLETVVARRRLIQQRCGLRLSEAVPPDMLYASGSGLDPDVSPEAARIQVGRVARARGFDETQRKALSRLVESSIEPPQFGLFGEPRVNILMLNLAVDRLDSSQ